MICSYPNLNKRITWLLLLTVMIVLTLNLSNLQGAEGETVYASFAAGDLDPNDFDVQGTVENINILVDENSQSEQNSISLNGEEYFFAPNAGIFDVNAVTVDMNDIVVGAEVCFSVDPSDMIVELGIIRNEPEIMDYEDDQTEDKSGHSNQPNGSGDLRLENGVWVN